MRRLVLDFLFFSLHCRICLLCDLFNKTSILCVIWSKMEFLLSQMCCHIPYPALRLSWQPDWWQISVVVLRKIVFPQLLPIFYWSAIILSRYYRFPHYMRLRQFTSFNPLLIPWNQIALPSLPPCSQSLTPFVSLWTGSLFGERVKISQGEWKGESL